MSNSADEMMVQPTANRPKLSDCGNEDRLSKLPDCIILRILSLLNTRQAVQTCVLSPRYEDLWKQLSVLIFDSRDFPTINIFANFVSNFLSLHDSSIPPQSFHFRHIGCLDPQLIKKAADYAISHNVQQLGLHVYCDFEQLPVTILSCHTITCRELSVYPGREGLGRLPVFPKSFSLPALTTLNLGNFAFCPTDNSSCAEPFSAFNRLNTLVIRQCSVRVAPTLCISNATLVNFTMHSHSYESYKIELCTPSLATFTYTGILYQKVFGNSLSYVKHVDIDAQVMFMEMQSPQILLSMLLEFVNTKSLTVTASTLQVLFFNANLLNMKLPSLGNLKCLKVKKEPLSYDLLNILNHFKLKKIRSPKKAAKLQKSFEAGLEPSAPIPDGTVNFLIQNSPLAEVEIIDCT